MRKTLIKNLLLTFLLSLLLTGLMFAIWYSREQRGVEEGQALTILFFVGTIFQNILLLLSALPVLLLGRIENIKPMGRAIMYFSGPVLLTTFFMVFVGNSWSDKLGFLLPGISFLAIHAFFYLQLNRKLLQSGGDKLQ